MLRTQQRIITAIFLVLACTNAQADADDFIDSGVLESPENLESGLEIGGMLINETITRFGHELYDVFKSAWRPLTKGVNYNIVIHEMFDQFRGSLISVKLNDNIIYQGIMSPNSESIMELGTNLAREIHVQLQSNIKLQEEEYY